MLFHAGNDAAPDLTPAHVRDRLAGRAARDGAHAAALTPAAVLLPLVTHRAGMTVLFTERTAHLADHAGQVSFPGGRVEPGDRDAVAAALRETEEEIGLAAKSVEVVGSLDVFATSTGFAVTPVVGLVAPPLALTLDAFEVAEAFEAPLGFLFDPANRRRESRMHRGRRREYWVIDYQGHTIWGVTARIVVDLCAALDACDAADRR